MDYLVENWGSFVGLLGLLASLGGLAYAFLARRAAKSAESAAREARHSISQTLCLVSAQRAISVILRLNTLHREQSWEAALELYRELRTLLNDISGMIPRELDHSRPEIDRGIGQLLMREPIGKHSDGKYPSFLRRQESRGAIRTERTPGLSHWIPAFAGMTDGLAIHSRISKCD